MKKPNDPAYSAARDLRKTLSFDILAAWTPRLRKKTVQQLIDTTLRDRLRSLTSVRYDRMACTPFTFFRGAACVMAYDLSLAPNTGIHAQLCGDAHVQNLGAFEGDDGRLIFDINDFDEAIRGPFEWDVKRMATSILLAGADAHLKPAVAAQAVEQFLNGYCSLIKLLLPLPVIEVARYQVHRLPQVSAISKILAKAQRATPLRMLEMLTTAYPKGRVFKSQPPLLTRVEDESQRKEILASLKPYLRSLQPERQHFFARFTPIDIAFKIVGTGSVGLRDYIVYMQGNGPADPLFVQIKQESASCYAPYLKHSGPKHNGHRVVDAQRAMQLQSDPLLGYTTIGPYDYLVRQLNDHKASINIQTLKPAGLGQYATVCGEMLARGHARSGDVRQIAGYIGNGRRFNRAILTYVQSYAAQMQSDWKAFTKASKH